MMVFADAGCRDMDNRPSKAQMRTTFHATTPPRTCKFFDLDTVKRFLGRLQFARFLFNRPISRCGTAASFGGEASNGFTTSWSMR
jgi:hypothetical protein